MFSVQCGQQLENEHMWLMPMSSERIRLWILVSGFSIQYSGLGKQQSKHTPHILINLEGA